MSNPIFQIVAAPDFACMPPGATVSYYAKVMDRDERDVSQRTKFQWFCFNDPAQVNHSIPSIVCGPEKPRWLDAQWDVVGHHNIVLHVTHPDGSKDIYRRAQWVDAITSILDRSFNPKGNDGNPSPQQVLIQREQYLGALLNIAKLNPPSEEQQEAHDKRVQELTDYIQHFKYNLRGLENKLGYAVDGLHMDKEGSARTNLLLWLANTTGPNRQPHWTLLDWTNPSNRYTTGVYKGSGNSHEDAIKAVIDAWESSNTYPEGYTQYQFTVPQHSIDLKGRFETDGQSFLGEVSSWLEWGALGASVVAGVATAVAPVPGSRLASLAIWSAIFASTTAATLNIVQRYDEGFSNWRDDSFDVLSIIGNIFASKLVWQIGARFSSVPGIAPDVNKVVFIGQIGTDSVQGFLLGEDYLSEFYNCLGDRNLSPDERLQSLLALLGSATIAGALSYIAIKGTATDLKNLKYGRTTLELKEFHSPRTILDANNQHGKVGADFSNKRVKGEVEGAHRTEVLPEVEGSPHLAIKGHVDGPHSQFSVDLETQVKARAEEIVAGKGGIGKQSAVATSKSGIEELGEFKSRPYENLGGKRQFRPDKVYAFMERRVGFVEIGEMTVEQYRIIDVDGYIEHVNALYRKGQGLTLHPKLEGMIRAYVKERVLLSHHGMPGLHAEVQALNEALHHLTKKGWALTEEHLRKIEIATYRTSGRKEGQPFTRCKNCQALVKSPPITLLTDHGNSALAGNTSGKGAAHVEN